MATKYYAVLTNVGAAKLANATALGAQVEITQMAVGDGNGALPTPNPTQTALVHELRREQLNTLSIDPNNANQIIAEQVIPEDVGGWWIREIGLFDKDGDMIAVANCAETYKPQLQEGSGRVQIVRMILIVSSAAAITLKIDPSVVLATREYVDDAIEAHAKSRNHPDATTKEKGLVQLSSAPDSDSETVAATPKAVKAVKEVADAAVKSVNSKKPDIAGNVKLGTAANMDTGTSGAKIPLLNTANTWSQPQIINNASLTITADSAVAHLQSSGGNSVLFFENADGSERAAIYSGVNTATISSLYFRAKTTAGVSAGQMELKSDGSLAVPGNTTVRGMVKPTNYSNFDDRYLLRSQDLPVGIPLPWSTATAPDGWLKCNGATFDKAKYPGLASAFPSGKLPDLRGEFIRGWDDGRGVDSDRVLLEPQGDAIRNINGEQSLDVPYNGKSTGAFYNNGKNANEGIYEDGSFMTDAPSVGGEGGLRPSQGEKIFFDASRVVPTASENRPRNIAFNYIVRAA
ncbi:phage tail protein [Klebsiella aerogenes]|nr:phage tail protein [Klebsiella aerogenes]ELA0229765.1 phage tail protein [Klebsiella aerogenes]